MEGNIGHLALGGHISTQNAASLEIIRRLPDYQHFGLEDAFKAFDTGNFFPLDTELIDPNFAGFYAGATRDSVAKKNPDTGELEPIPERIEQAIRFVKNAKLDYLVGSGGDDHGIQMKVLGDAFMEEGIDCKVLVLSKTMDGDKGGLDGDIVTLDGGIRYEAPFSDMTNGFHTAIDVGLNSLNNSRAGEWTNNSVTVLTHFGRDANWVNAALAWYGNADLAIYGELPTNDEGIVIAPHPIEKITDLISDAQRENFSRYGRRFASVVVSEGTSIEGVNQIADEKDVHGNVKLDPEELSSLLSALLKSKGIKTQSYAKSYEMRNSPPTQEDLGYATFTGMQIAEAIRSGETDKEAVIQFRNGAVVSEMVPIELSSRKRLARYYPEALYDPKNLAPLPAIGQYFKPMLGTRIDLDSILPAKPTVINVYANGK